MNSIDYARGFDAFLDSLGADVRRAWDRGEMVPCDECWGEGEIPVMHGNTIRVLRCDECGGTGYVMEKDNG